MNGKPASLISLTLLASVASTAPALAGTVYVPLPGYATVGGAQWEANILVANAGAEQAVFKKLFLAADSDGTVRPAPPTEDPLGPRQTTGLVPQAGAAGLYELQGPDVLAFSAKLIRVGQPDSAGVFLPVLGSRDLFAADDTAFVQGIRRSASAETDWMVVNLGHQAAQCRLRVFANDGAQLASTAVVPMPPLAMRTYPDFLSAIGVTEAANVRVDASCDRSFYTFAMTRDEETGEVAFLGPSAEGTSSLRLPGAGGCPAGSACFTVDGLVHAPTPAVPVKRVSFQVPAGTYRQVHLQMEVTHGGWDDANSAGLHMLFWLVKNRNFYMYGYANFEGPTDNQIMFRHGVELTHPEKIRILKAFAAQPGHTYNLDYTYDTEQGFLELIVFEGGVEKARLRGTPNVSSVGVGAGDLFHIDIGFDGSNPNERPTYGWIYRDIKLDIHR